MKPFLASLQFFVPEALYLSFPWGHLRLFTKEQILKNEENIPLRVTIL